MYTATRLVTALAEAQTNRQRSSHGVCIVLAPMSLTQGCRGVKLCCGHLHRVSSSQSQLITESAHHRVSSSQGQLITESAHHRVSSSQGAGCSTGGARHNFSYASNMLVKAQQRVKQDSKITDTCTLWDGQGQV